MSSKIIDRIRKVLSRTESSNVHEASTAAALAARLMTEHKLSAVDLNVDDEGKVFKFRDMDDVFHLNWKKALLTYVARAFFCEAVFNRAAKKGRLVGKPDDLEVAVEAYQHLLESINRELRVYMTEFPEASRDAFRKGCVTGVVDRMKRDREAFEKTNERALVLSKTTNRDLREFLAQHFGAPLVINEKTERPTDESSYADGYLAGLEMTVVTSKSKKQLPENEK